MGREEREREKGGHIERIMQQYHFISMHKLIIIIIMMANVVMLHV